MHLFGFKQAARCFLLSFRLMVRYLLLGFAQVAICYDFSSKLVAMQVLFSFEFVAGKLQHLTRQLRQEEQLIDSF